jgi:ABC-type antimicrobial peptide transport system ATPase subunit
MNLYILTFFVLSTLDIHSLIVLEVNESTNMQAWNTNGRWWQQFSWNEAEGAFVNL